MKHKYQLIIEFESDKPVKIQPAYGIQYENALGHFVFNNGYDSINSTFIYGTGKTKLKKLKKD